MTEYTGAFCVLELLFSVNADQFMSHTSWEQLYLAPTVSDHAHKPRKSTHMHAIRNLQLVVTVS